jgi:hypothetical protein
MYGAVGLIKTWDVSCLFFSSFRSNINLISMTGQELLPPVLYFVFLLCPFSILFDLWVPFL